MEIDVIEEGKKVVANTDNTLLFRAKTAQLKNNMYRFAINFLNVFSKTNIL